MNIEEKLNAVKEKAEDIVNDVKESKPVEALKNSGVGKEILGEDGKLGKEDFARMANDVKESKVGKAILGDDGKLDKEDLKRISEDATDAVKGVVGKVTGLFKK